MSILFCIYFSKFNTFLYAAQNVHFVKTKNTYNKEATRTATNSRHSSGRYTYNKEAATDGQNQQNHSRTPSPAPQDTSDSRTGREPERPPPELDKIPYHAKVLKY